MSKILAIDYGKKRTGYAISDENKVFAFGLSTQESKQNFTYLNNLCDKENISIFLIGIPKKLNNEMADIVPEILDFIEKLKQEFPAVNIVELDERFTSKMAFQSMIDSGMKKKDRKNKALVDEIAATILLQNYLSSIK